MEHVNATCVAAFEAVSILGCMGSLYVTELVFMLVSQSKLRQHLVQNVEGTRMYFIHWVSSQLNFHELRRDSERLRALLSQVMCSYQVKFNGKIDMFMLCGAFPHL